MWYSVLRCEHTIPNIETVRAGSIYRVQRYTDEIVLCTPVEGMSAQKAGPFKISAAKARQVFTRPTQSFSDAVEESIMQCEANYC